MKPVRLALLAAALTLLAPIAAAQAAPTLVSPAQGSTVRTIVPVFTFTPAVSEKYDLFRLSKSPKVDAKGWLVLGNDIVIGDGDVTGTTFHLPKGYTLDQGTYYWQVMGYGDGPDGQVQVKSAPTKFAVAALLNFAGVRVKLEPNATNSGTEAAFYAKVRGNLTHACTITLVVKRGTKVVFRQPRTQDCNGSSYVNTFLNMPGGKVAKGTPLTATLVLTGGGATVTSKVLPFRAP
jgi:hypothetical protein